MLAGSQDAAKKRRIEELKAKLAVETEAQDAAKVEMKRRREELMAKLASKTEAQNSDEATKRHREELMATLAADPRFKIRSGPARRSSCRAECRRSQIEHSPPGCPATAARSPADATSDPEAVAAGAPRALPG